MFHTTSSLTQCYQFDANANAHANVDARGNEALERKYHFTLNRVHAVKYTELVQSETRGLEHKEHSTLWMNGITLKRLYGSFTDTINYAIVNVIYLSKLMRCMGLNIIVRIAPWEHLQLYSKSHRPHGSQPFHDLPGTIISPFHPCSLQWGNSLWGGIPAGSFFWEEPVTNSVIHKTAGLTVPGRSMIWLVLFHCSTVSSLIQSMGE